MIYILAGIMFLLVMVLLVALLVESVNFYTAPPRNATLRKIKPFKRGKK